MTLDNARAIWDRCVETNRRDIEERAEQLKSISNLAALVAGFAMISFLQFQFQVTDASQAITMGFGISTALVVSMRWICLCAGLQLRGSNPTDPVAGSLCTLCSPSWSLKLVCAGPAMHTLLHRPPTMQRLWSQVCINCGSNRTCLATQHIA